MTGFISRVQNIKGQTSKTNNEKTIINMTICWVHKQEKEKYFCQNVVGLFFICCEVIHATFWQSSNNKLNKINGKYQQQQN